MDFENGLLPPESESLTLGQKQSLQTVGTISLGTRLALAFVTMQRGLKRRRCNDDSSAAAASSSAAACAAVGDDATVLLEDKTHAETLLASLRQGWHERL